MQSGRIGKIEEETQVQDLDQLERDIALEAEDEAEADSSSHSSIANVFTETAALLTFPLVARPANSGPAQNQNQPLFGGRSAQSKFTLPGAEITLPTKLSQSRFAPTLYEKMLMQMGITLGPAREPKPFGPFLPVEDKSLRRKPANDTGFSRFMPAKADEKSAGMKSRFFRLTIEALMQLGAMPGQLLQEVSRIRNARENRFFSAVRLEKALGQGHEDAEQFVNRRPSRDKNQPLPPKA
jgi:hypothetical protein